MTANQSSASSSNIFDDILGIFGEVQQEMKDKPLTPGSMRGIIEKLQTGLQQINARAEEVYAKAGMNAEQIKQYAENPSNFTKQEWETLQRIKGEIDRYKADVEAIVGPISMKVNEKIIEEQRANQATASPKVGKRGRKGWLPS